MHRMLFRGIVAATAFAVAFPAWGEPREGKYVSEDAGLELTIREQSDDVVICVLTAKDGRSEFTAKLKSGRYTGKVEIGGEEFPLALQWNGKLVNVEIGPAGEGEMIEFVRADSDVSKAVAKDDSPSKEKAGTHNVIINGKHLTDVELAHAEKTYGIRVPDADYWYDDVLGAWGVRGGPTMGFISPGLELGGELQADASGGGTAVFVNGRALHPYDLAALQQITGPIMPGRYFINAQGYAGIEGGPPVWDLGAMVAQSGGGGGSNTWQSRITGASGFSDGTTGAVFLPNGGIVSTGN